MHQRRVFFLRAVTIFLCYALDKDWKIEEMQGWGVGKDRLARPSAARGSVGRAMNDKRSRQPCHES